MLKKGSPFYKVYYKDVIKVEKNSKDSVKFYFNEENINRELVLIIGQLPVLPAHYWKNHEFSKSSLVPPLGSGAYRIKKFDSLGTLASPRLALDQKAEFLKGSGIKI